MLFRSNDTATTEIYTQFDTLSLHDALPTSVATAIIVGGIICALAAPLYIPAWRAERVRSAPAELAAA